MKTNDLDMICSMFFEKVENLDKLMLNKLLYLLQAYTLVKNGITAFDSRIEAWIYGPVVPEVYFTMRENPNYYKNIDSSSLKKDIKENIEAVVKEYGEVSPFLLVELIHSYETWIKAWNHGEGKNRVIDVEDIYSYHFEKSKENNGRLF